MNIEERIGRPMKKWVDTIEEDKRSASVYVEDVWRLGQMEV